MSRLFGFYKRYQCYEQYRAARARFGAETSDEECQADYQLRLELKKINYMENKGTCVICSTITSFPPFDLLITLASIWQCFRNCIDKL